MKTFALAVGLVVVSCFAVGCADESAPEETASTSALNSQKKEERRDDRHDKREERRDDKRDTREERRDDRKDAANQPPVTEPSAPPADPGQIEPPTEPVPPPAGEIPPAPPAPPPMFDCVRFPFFCIPG